MALAGSANKYFESIVAKRSPYQANKVGASVRLFSLHRDEHGHPVPNATLDYKERIDDDLWLVDARKEYDRLVSCGYSDTVGVMTGEGHSIREATKRAYRAIGQFSFEGAYYRPEFDFMTTEYKSSIVNRVNYGLERGLFTAKFGVC